MTQDKLVSLLSKYKNDRPKPERKWDQFFANEETTAKRALYLQTHGELQGRIVLLGDDDLTSIALAALGANVTVLEIDDRLVNLIKRISQKEGLKIQIQEQNILENLPKNLLGKFDTVLTDPPYTPGGVSIFLNKALMLLAKAPTSGIYLCYGTGSKAQDRAFQIQEIITQKGLFIEEKLENFNEYKGASTIGNKSSLYRLRVTPQTKMTPYPGARIYTNQ